MSPLEINMLLWCHARCQPHPDLDRAPMYRETIAQFVEDGLVEPWSPANIANAGDCRDKWLTTNRGRALVEMLCAVPLPEQAWIDPRTRRVIDRDRPNPYAHDAFAWARERFGGLRGGEAARRMPTA